LFRALVGAGGRAHCHGQRRTGPRADHRMQEPARGLRRQVFARAGLLLTACLVACARPPQPLPPEAAAREAAEAMRAVLARTAAPLSPAPAIAAWPAHEIVRPVTLTLWHPSHPLMARLDNAGVR